MTGLGRLKGLKGLKDLGAHPALLVGIAAGVAVGALVPPRWADGALERVLMGWNAGTWVYVAWVTMQLRRAGEAQIRRRARREDEARTTILVLALCGAMASLAAIALEMARAHELHGAARATAAGLGALTVLSSWAFMQTVFAVHYAHEYYDDAPGARGAEGSVAAHYRGGLDFLGSEPPDFWDFVYFSCVIGATAQTADVGFTTRRMRRLGLVHGVLTFFYNTTVLALLVNVASTLLTS